MNSLASILSEFNCFNTKEIELFLQFFKIKKLKKHDILLHFEEINTRVYFVETGILREFSYFDDSKEQENTITRWFTGEGNFVISATSFYLQTPSKIAIEAIEDCVIYYVEKKDLDYLYEHFPQTNKIGRLVVEQNLVLYENLNYLIRIHPAQLRYEFFEKIFSKIAYRIPEKHKASFLCISQAELSRIRKKIANGHIMSDSENLNLF